MSSEDKVTVSELISIFRDRVGKLYPPGEVEAMMALVFERLLQFRKSDLIIHARKKLHRTYRVVFESVIQALEAHEPIQYILGRTEFYGLDIAVDERVLIPRPETEELVKWILDSVENENVKILDIGTGSGCIAIALKKNLPNAKVYALDSSLRALDLAAENAGRNQVRIHFFHRDILRSPGLEFMDFDVIVSNPPYIPMGEMESMSPHVVVNEPHEALFVPDDDPLIFYRTISDLAEGHLRRGGSLYFEVHEGLGKEVAYLLQDRRYAEVEGRNDLNGKYRMVRGKRP